MGSTNVILQSTDTAFSSPFARQTRYMKHDFVFFTFPGKWTLSPKGFRLQNPAKLLKLTNTWPLLSNVCLGLLFPRCKLSVDKTIIFLTCSINYVLLTKSYISR